MKNSLEKNYNVLRVDFNKDFEKKLKLFKPDIVFNALHGRFGEDGYAQTVLEYNKVKYTHSGVLSSALAMDKEISKKIFIKNKILTPKFIIFKYNLKNIDNLKITIKKIKYPVVIKPINEGSSVDVYISDEKTKKSNQMHKYDEILIENT